MRRVFIPTLIVGCLLALLLACFGAVLFGGRQFAYRDAAHFYYPLYLRVEQEWHAGRWPLWSAEENAGMPLLGNPTAAVLYPGKLIYSVFPLEHYAWGARLYVIAHTALAFAGLWALLRSWGVSLIGSAIGGLSYAFGAPILFQYCNIIFLVGAAWAPWGFRAIDRLVRLGRRGALPELAIVLAMQTLGGDPQAAYLTVLCGAGYALALAWSGVDRPRPRPRRRAALVALVALGVLAWIATPLALAHLLLRVESPSVRMNLPWPWQTLVDFLLEKPVARGAVKPPTAWHAPSQAIVLLGWAVVGAIVLWRWHRRGILRSMGWRPFVLVVASALALGLTAAQLVPVLEYTGLSVRAAEEGPHNVYPFSLEPHRVVEWIWPNVFGTVFEGNRMWLPLLPPRRTTASWVPSLYLGGTAFLLAAGALGFRGGPPWRAWLTAVALLSFVGSLGEYASPLWWARSVPGWEAYLGKHDPPIGEPARNDGSLHDGDGSPYYLMAVLLPGFRSFRYPSKLLTFTCLALAALAGLGWDRLLAGRSRRVLVLNAGLLVASATVLGLAVASRGRIVATIAAKGAGIGSILGPIDPSGALVDLLGALVHGTLVLLLTSILFVASRRRPRAAGMAALILLTADLAIANARLVFSLPQSVFEEKPEVLRRIEEAERKDPSPGPYRVHRMPLWEPPGWHREGSPGRFRELVEWERSTLQPKYGLPYGLNYTLTEGTTELYDYWWFFAAFYRTLSAQSAQYLKGKPGDQIVYYPRRGFDLWNTRYFILPYYPAWHEERRGIASFLSETKPIAPDAEKFAGPEGKKRLDEWVMKEDWQILRNQSAYPRAWIVHKAKRLDPIRGLRKQDRKALMEDIIYQNDVFWHDPDHAYYDPRELAWIEADDMTRLQAYFAGGPPAPGETVKVTRYDPLRVELTAVLERPGLVVLSDVYYPGWRLTIDGEEATILRANRLMRGAAVKEGRHDLVYTYEPRSFRIGGVISLASLATLLILLIRAGISSVRPGARDPAGPDSG